MTHATMASLKVVDSTEGTKKVMSLRKLDRSYAWFIGSVQQFDLNFLSMQAAEKYINAENLKSAGYSAKTQGIYIF